MTQGFLHGIETIQIDDGLRPIRPVRSSVIGLVGTAPGADADKFPLNQPVLIRGRRADAAGLGGRGTLPAAIEDIFAQAGALIVVVRVEAGTGKQALETTKTNVIGKADKNGARTGCLALLDAQTLHGVTPRILIAPDMASDKAVIDALTGIADKTRGIVVADGPGTNDKAVTGFRKTIGSSRVYLVDPGVKAFRNGSNVDRPASGFVAGLIAKTDETHGYWWSPSNQTINGIIGTTRPIVHSLADATAQSQLLNSSEIATIVRQNGFRLFGNRTCSNDAQWAFLSVRRTADMIYEAIERGHAWALDRPFSPQLLHDIVDGVNAFLRSLVARNALLGGKATLNPELNNEASLKAGRLYVDFDIEPPAPLERMTFRAYRNGDYYSELVASALAA